MFHHVLFVSLLIAASAVFALLEIEIEGEKGWATGLPTWRFENHVTRRLVGAREITGYHVYFQLFLFLLLHLPYALGLPPTFPAELRIIAFGMLFWVAEDFLWFVLNPAWGIRRFRREFIPWHAQTWWGFMPRDYWVFVPVGIACYVISWVL